MKTQSHLSERFFTERILPDCPIYDMHGHMGPFYGIRFSRADTDIMAKTLDQSGVKLLVFCHHAALFCPDIGNTANIEAVRRHPDKFKAYCGLNPNYPDAIRKNVETFDQYRDVFVGFKFLADYHGYPVTDDRYRPAWEFADSEGQIMLLHTWGGSPCDGPEQVRQVAEKYPNTKILMGHSLHGDWETAAKVANEYPNLYLELTAVMDDRGALEMFVQRCGSQKTVFGTDFPWYDHRYYIGAVLGADITDEDRRNILYRNAEKLLMG